MSTSSTMDVPIAERRGARRFLSVNFRMRERVLLLADQVCFSLANFALTITLARAYSASIFAAFGVALSIALIVQLAQRNLYVLRFSLLTPRTAARYLPGILAEHLMLLALLMVVLAVALAGAVIAHASPFTVEVTISIPVCCLVYFQVEFDRAVQIKRRSPLGAFVLSALYLLVVALLGVLAFKSGLSYYMFMAGLSVFSILKGVYCTLYVVRPRLRWGWRLLKDDLRFNGWTGFFYAVIFAGFTHVPVMILAAFAPAAETAGFIAMRGLTQPFNLILRSLDAADKNRFRSASRERIAGARRTFWRLFAIYGAVPLLGTLVLSLDPDLVVHLAYGDKYHGMAVILIGWCLYFTLLGLANPFWSVVRLFSKDGEYMVWSAIGALVTVGLSLALCRPFGTHGVMAAILAGMAFTLLGSMVTVRSIIFGSADGPLPSEARRSSRRARPATRRPTHTTGRSAAPQAVATSTARAG